jgi:hypothetical protein
MLNLTRNAASTSYALLIDMAGNSGPAGIGVVTGAGSSEGLAIGSSGTGRAIAIAKSGSNNALYISNTGSSHAIQVDVVSGAGNALNVTYAGTQYAVYAANNTTSNGIFDAVTTLAGYTANLIQTYVTNATAANYAHIRCYHEASAVFRVRGDGATYGASWTNGGADYAELVTVSRVKTDYEPGDVMSINGDDVFHKSQIANDIKVAGVYSTKPGALGGQETEYNIDMSSGVGETASWVLVQSGKFQGAYDSVKLDGDQTAHYPVSSNVRIQDAKNITLHVSAVSYDATSNKTMIAFDSGCMDAKSKATSTLYHSATERNTIPLSMVGRVPTKCITENGSISPGDLLVTSSTLGYAMKAPAQPILGTILGKALTSLADNESGTATGMVTVYVNLQ